MYYRQTFWIGSFFFALFGISSYTWPNLVINGGGVDADQKMHLHFGHVPLGAKEERRLQICLKGGGTEQVDIDTTGSFKIGSISGALVNDTSASFELTENECTDLTIEFLPEQADCPYQVSTGMLGISSGSIDIELQGVSVRSDVWQNKQMSSGWRYGGTHVVDDIPLLLKTTGKNVVWLGHTDEDGIRLSSFTHHQLSPDNNFMMDFNHFKTNDYVDRLPFIDKTTITRITDLSVYNGLFAAAQPNGYVLVYNASNYQPLDQDSYNEADYWASRGFGGSPRLCSGPCLFLSCAYTEPNNNPECEGRSIDCLCGLRSPTQGEHIAISSVGPCILVTDALGRNINTLSFNFTDPSRLNRSYNDKLSDIDLTDKVPGLLSTNNNNNMLVVNRINGTSSAVHCDVSIQKDTLPTSEESKCELGSCFEICHKSFASAVSIGFMDDDNIVIADSLEQRVYLIDRNGRELVRYPEQREADSCELYKAVNHPNKPIVIILYRNPSAIVLVSFNNNQATEVARFDETSVPDLGQPIDADFVINSGSESLLVATEGQNSIVRFQTIPLEGLPAGLKISEAISLFNETNTVCLNSSIISSNTCQFGKSTFVESCDMNDSGDSFPTIIVSAVSAVLVAVTTATVIITVIVVKRCLDMKKKSSSVDLNISDHP